MKGLIVPEQTEDYTADPVELFFDLAFVFAFSQIVHMLVVHPDWEHIGRAALIFFLIWLPWTQFTWAANAVPGNQRSVRLAFLVATVATVPIGRRLGHPPSARWRRTAMTITSHVDTPAYPLEDPPTGQL